MVSNDPKFQALCSQIEEEMRKLRIPGVALGLIYGDQQWTAGFGITSVENPLAVDDETLFQVGSITKTFVGLTAMRLIEAGKLNLHEPVITYLPELRLADEAATRQATLEHLFTHTGGWVGDYFDDTGMGEDALREIVRRMIALPQITPLGQVYSYNNAGFYLAGRVIEAVCGKPFETVVRELVLEPLRMQRSFFFPAEVITYRTASGHDAVYDEKINLPPVARPWALARSGHPAGGLISTACDLLKYARFWLGEGPALLTPQSMVLMQTPRVQSAGKEWVGLTWFIREVGGKGILRHGGATNGFTAAFEFVPTERFAIIVLNNSDRGPEMYHDLVRRAIHEFLGLDDAVPEPVQAEESELAGYAGFYRAAGSDLELSLRGGELWVRTIPKGGFPTKDSPPSPPPPDYRLGLLERDRVICLDMPMKGNQGQFLRDTAGEIEWFRLSGRLHKRLGSG